MVGHAFPVFAHFRGGKAVMCFVGGGIALCPPAGAAALVVCAAVSAATSFKWGARVGVFAFPGLQLVFDPVTHVMGTGVLMTMIGALFGLDRLRGRAPQAA
jgi:glycerol-3-phosphate acyltransferase PlsY